jgi:RNA polymerase sigma factor (sigma-70 family)
MDSGASEVDLMMHPSCAGMVGKLARKPIKRPRDRHAAGKADELSRRMITGSPRRLVDESPGQETTLAASEEFDNRRKALADALDGRDRRIFEGRRLAGDPITLAELADEFGVSRERVRQIEVRAFEKVQKAVKNRVAAMETSAPLAVH